MPIICAKNICFRYAAKPVLEEVSFALEAAQIVAMIGPNGSGKTTLLKMLNATLFPNSGQVLIEGQDTRHWPRQAIARTVAIVPQESPAIFPFFAEEIVLMGRFPYLRSLAFEDKKDYRIVQDVMARTDSLSFAHRRFNELSAGERQRVLIARALAQEPKILLLDESTVFLDLKHQAQFLSLLRELSRKQHLTVVFVTHDLNLAAQNADQLLLLYNGKKYAIGTPADILTAQNIKEVYDVDVGIDPNPHNGSPRVTLMT
ncbi:MAG: ABC transporter ATP-binding protein [Smithellaceae bacterium]|jgi:iron complex transport system ATP-binding protein|nr:ABC transporter ATP-binding protein [Smithellaceae bacterium]